MYQLCDFSSAQFLRQHWQQSPCVLSGVLHDFVDPLDEHDLAGLAQEEAIDSRIISQHNQQWQVTEGPFFEFSDVCVGAWTLMVQGVDAHIEEAAALMKAFDFIPHWRMDDLLVSFSQPGAGVGAHVDQYDVFIIQGKGQRRWQVGAKPEQLNQHYPHPKLQQSDEFAPLIDVLLNPGDVLYIPPGFPHKGESISPCMNYSVGFRAPQQMELVQAIADDLLDTGKPTQRFVDPKRADNQQPAAISEHDMAALKQLLTDYVANPKVDEVLTQYLSKQTDSLDNYAMEDPLCIEELTALLHQGITLRHACGVRPVYLAEQHSDSFMFCINGEMFTVSGDERLLTEPLLNQTQSNLTYSPAMSGVWIEVLRDLINRGYIDIVSE